MIDPKNLEQVIGGVSEDADDERDLVYKNVATPTSEIIDLTPVIANVYQQALHDCVVHPIASAFQVLRQKKGLEPWIPSRRFLYYSMRKLDGTIISDLGGTLRSGLKALKKWGVPKDEVYPYDPVHLSWRPHWIVQPPPEVYAAAKLDFDIEYCTVKRNIKNIKSAMTEGYPVMFAFDIPRTFLSPDIAKTGLFTWGQKGFLRVRHAVLLCRLNDKTETATVLNSFGSEWGKSGFFEMPYKFLLSTHCTNFWILKEKIAHR